MADLYAVAFVGNGDTSKENVAGLLADFLSEDKEYNPPIFPSVRSGKGVVNSYDWVAAEFGTDNVDEVDLPLIVNALLKQRDDADAPAIPFLVFAPPEELDEADANYHAVVKARDAGIRVLDLTAGLDDFAFPGPVDSGETGPNGEAIPEPSSISTGRRRGVPRDPEKDAEIAANMQREDPPWDEDEPEAEAPAAPVAPVVPAGVQVTLSQATVDLLLATFTSLAQDVATALTPKPKSEMVAVFVTEDGVYRRATKGRPRNGETRTEITAEQAKELGL